MAFAVGREQKVELREVRTGIALGEDRQVLSGLSAGDMVVVDPPATLKDGDKVTEAAAGK